MISVYLLGHDLWNMIVADIAGSYAVSGFSASAGLAGIHHQPPFSQVARGQYFEARFDVKCGAGGLKVPHTSPHSHLVQPSIKIQRYEF